MPNLGDRKAPVGQRCGKQSRRVGTSIVKRTILAMKLGWLQTAGDCGRSSRRPIRLESDELGELSSSCVERQAPRATQDPRRCDVHDVVKTKVQPNQEIIASASRGAAHGDLARSGRKVREKAQSTV